MGLDVGKKEAVQLSGVGGEKAFQPLAERAGRGLGVFLGRRTGRAFPVFGDVQERHAHDPPFPRAAAGGEAYLGAEQAALGVAERECARPRVVGKGFVPGFKQLFGKPAGGDIGEAQGVGIAGCRREQAAGRVVDDQQPARGDVEREDGIADAADVHLAGPGPPVRRIRRREEGFLEEPVIERVVFAGPALQDVRPVAVRQPEGDGGGAAGGEHVPEFHEQGVILAPYGFFPVTGVLEQARHVEAGDAPAVEDLEAGMGDVDAPDQAGKSGDPRGKLLHAKLRCLGHCDGFRKKGKSWPRGDRGAGLPGELPVGKEEVGGRIVLVHPIGRIPGKKAC